MVTYTIALNTANGARYDLPNVTAVRASDYIDMRHQDEKYDEIRVTIGDPSLGWTYNGTNYNIDNVDHTIVKVKKPDGTIITLDNTSDEIQELDRDIVIMAAFLHLYYIHIPNDPGLTDQAGTYFYQIELYDEEDDYIGNYIFGARVAEVSVRRTEKRNLDMWAGAAPTILHLNQGEQNVKLIFSLFDSNGTVYDNTATLKAKLVAREPRSQMKEEIPVVYGDGSYLSPTIRNSSNIADVTVNDISKLTEHCGKVEAQIVLFHRGNGWSENKPFVSNGVEFSSSKIYIYVEPRP